MSEPWTDEKDRPLDLSRNPARNPARDPSLDPSAESGMDLTELEAADESNLATYACTADRSERLDRFLAAQWPNLSRSRFQKLIEAGQVQVNDAPCTNKHGEVKSGDRIVVTIPPDRPLSLEPQAIPLDILYEDSQVIVINKPAGMVVHPAPGHPDGTMVNALLAHCKTLPGMEMPSINGVQRPGVVHRLDRDTTGAIMFAKTDLANQHLQAQLRYKVAQRTYLGIVYGAPRDDRGVVDLPIGRHPVDRKKQAIVPVEKGGRKAITHWFIEERLGNYTLIRFELQTGRTHQIRVHSAELGHPIVGDPVYGSGRSIGVNLPGQALHAWKLRFQHPLNYEWIDTEAPLPEHFQTLLEVLRRRSGPVF
ncbi:RluA family pseudouridine synthase [Limnothrix sp. PR1529]|uniref:RluA family pseudouridine synthase n=1 Tax=Limnothrix sp. PR1529 TaxID=1704291 RepID=UPI001F31D8C3|nr:RluA family pseudouridine synthase [Limnothrix sp. PR1529]